jgi:hypothetical protein
MSTTISPNMSLVIPGVGSEAGPAYATDVNNSLTIIDSHNHSSGSGVQITPNGININSALTFNGQAATYMGSIGFSLSGTAPTLAQSLYVLNGSETIPLPDLWYFDGTTNIQITQNGIVNATASALPGQSYASGTFIWKQGAASTTPGNFDIGSVVIRPNIAATTNGVTLAASSTGSFTLTLPSSLPTANMGYLAVDTTGAMTSNTFDNSTLTIISNVAQIKAKGVTQGLLANRVTGSTVAAGGIAINGITSLTVPSGTSTVTAVTITTTGRPVMIMATSNHPDAFIGFITTGVPTANLPQVRLSIVDELATEVMSVDLVGYATGSGISLRVPLGQSNIAFPVAGTHTYTASLTASTANTTAFITFVNLIVYEL